TPPAEPSPQRGNEHDDDQRNHGQEISRQNGSAHKGHENCVRSYDHIERELRITVDGPPLHSVILYWAKRHGDREQRREHVKIQVSKQLPESQQKSKEHSQGLDGCLNVEAEQYRVPKDEAG